MKGKKTMVLIAALSALMFATASIAEQVMDQGSAMQKDNLYKGYTKAEHVKAFPAGHPAVSTQNRCFWDEEAGLYFCQFDNLAPTVK